jgi:hypothetical protein
MRFVYNISIMHIHHHPTCKFIVLIVEIDFEESETHTSHCVGFLRVSLANLPIGIAGGEFFLTRRNTNGIVLTPLRSSLRFYSCHLRHLWPWPQRFFLGKACRDCHWKFWIVPICNSILGGLQEHDSQQELLWPGFQPTLCPANRNKRWIPDDSHDQHPNLDTKFNFRKFGH